MGAVMGMTKSVDAYLMTAQRLVESCDIEKAIGDFDKVLNEDRRNVSALLGKAECLVHYVDERKNLEDGLKIVDSLIDEHDQVSFDLYFLRARFLWKLGRRNDALKCVGICERFAPDSIELLETKARILVGLRRFTEAETIMHELPEKKANFVKGRIDFLHKKYSSASMLFRQSFEDDFTCNDVTNLYNYMLASHLAKDYDLVSRAADVGEKFLAKHKNHIGSTRIANRTFLCLWTKSKITKTESEAKDCLQKMTEIVDDQQRANKADWVLVRNKSLAYKNLGKFDQAEVAIDESFGYLKKKQKDYDIKYQDALRMKADILLLMKKFKKSLVCSKKLLTYIEKQNTPAQKASKETRSTFTHHGESFGYTKSSIDTPQIINSLRRISTCYSKLGDYKNSKRWYSKYEKAYAEAKILKEKESKSGSEIPIYDGDEGQRLELKSSFYNHGTCGQEDTDTYKNKQEKLQHEIRGFEEIAKSVCAFLNSDGGKVVIGVTDELECLGIEADIERAPKKTLDGYKQQVRQTIDNMLVKDYVTSVFYDTFDYVSPGSKPVKLCEISVEPLPSDEAEFATLKLHGKAVKNEKGKFLKYASDGPEYAFFRKGEGDQQYTPREAVAHWIRRSKR